MWAPYVPPTPAVVNETQPVDFASPVQLRPGTHFTDGWAGVFDGTVDLFFFPPALVGFELVTLGLEAQEPNLSTTRAHTHTHSLTHTCTLTLKYLCIAVE